MPIHRYKGRYSNPTNTLYRLGLLKQMPIQKEVTFLRDQGVNIIYRLKGCTPEKFRHTSHLFLEVALAEANRYPDYKWRFARFDVKLNRTMKGRRLPDTLTFTAGKHTDSYIMVYGPGYEVDQKIFLVDKVEQILDIPARYLGRVSRQRPYTVIRLEICLRMGEELIIESKKEA